MATFLHYNFYKTHTHYDVLVVQCGDVHTEHHSASMGAIQLLDMCTTFVLNRLVLIVFFLSLEPECVDGNVGFLESSGVGSEYRTVQFCIYGIWGLIGGNDWDDTDASVICGELGFLPHSKEWSMFDIIIIIIYIIPPLAWSDNT